MRRAVQSVAALVVGCGRPGPAPDAAPAEAAAEARFAEDYVTTQDSLRLYARILGAPVLTVHGTQDPNAPVEGGRAWASLIPEARILELEGVGHAPWLEAPEEFFGEVDAFLRAGP